jgi:hypothetical protein
VALPFLRIPLALIFGQLANGAFNEVPDELWRSSLELVGELPRYSRRENPKDSK